MQALIFPEVSTFSNRAPAIGESRSGSELSASMFASGTHGQFTWLAEYFKSKDESEVERAQIGWRFSDRDVVWLGRMHTPLGFWNTEFHHGTYLQMSHHRPVIDDFEDAGSPLPKHFIGAMWEGSRATGDGGAIRYSLAWGQQPRWGGTAFEPKDILGRVKLGPHRNGGGARIAYRPDEVNTDEIGVSAHQFTALGDGQPVEKIEQFALALHAIKSIGPLKLSTTLSSARNTVYDGSTRAGRRTGHFLSMWVQGEYGLTEKLTAYARVERTFRAQSDPLLRLMPSFRQRQDVLGLRWDLLTNQAVRIELLDGREAARPVREIELSWSTVFP